MKLFTAVLLLILLLTACGLAGAPSAANTLVPPQTGYKVPNFGHIALILFENTEFDKINGNPQMPALTAYAHQYTLLTETFAVTHPSLPNYLALIGGDTFGITTDCSDCFVNAISLPDLIEKSGRTWKSYQEDMPSPCFLGNQGEYVQKHNPFIYFTPIRTDQARCQRSIVPLTQLEPDIANDALPDFIFITPNMCNNGHDCKKEVVDAWIKDKVSKLQTALDADGDPYLIILTWDEGTLDGSCCGLPKNAGGHVAVFLISPQVKNGFVDNTQYTHYSLLKTISQAWNMPYLGHAADASNAIITAPWK